MAKDIPLKYFIIISFFISFSLLSDQRTYYKIDASHANLEKEGFYFVKNDIDKGSDKFGSFFSIIYPLTYDRNYTFKRIHIHIFEGEKELFSSQISEAIFNSNKYLQSTFHYFEDKNKVISLHLLYEHNSTSEVYSLSISDIRKIITKKDILQVSKILSATLSH